MKLMYLARYSFTKRDPPTCSPLCLSLCRNVFKMRIGSVASDPTKEARTRSTRQTVFGNYAYVLKETHLLQGLNAYHIQHIICRIQSPRFSASCKSHLRKYFGGIRVRPNLPVKRKLHAK